MGEGHVKQGEAPFVMVIPKVRLVGEFKTELVRSQSDNDLQEN
jgi:hypothetical protein